MSEKGIIACILALVFFIILVIVLMTSIVKVPAGHVGVYDEFGYVSPNEFQPGLHVKPPWVNIVSMSVKTQEYTMSYTAGEGAKYESDVIASLTKEGLTVNLDITVLYRLHPDKADVIYKTVGVDYVNVIVRPQIRTAIRDVIAKYEAKQIYSEDRQAVALEIFDEMEPALSERGIILEKVLLRHVELPIELTKAIEAKLTAEQNIAKKAFEVEEAKQEANRKREEAQGIADANEIIANSLSDAYLKWYWIGQLEKSNVYYVPVGEDGLPIIKVVE